jgi:quercetin dioxygenase-like cupin family protein
MKRRTKLLIGAAAAAVIGIGVVFATPIVGLTSPFLAVGTQNADLEASGKGTATSGAPFRVHVHTEGPSTSSIQDASIEAGGHNGWHSHPGMVVVVLLSGSITWYDENCNPTNYKAGDTWVEGDKVHSFKVTSPKPIHLMAYFLTAQGVPVRTDEPDPACAASVGY